MKFMLELTNIFYLIAVLGGLGGAALLAMFMLGMIDTVHPDAFILMLIAAVTIPLGIARALQGWTENAWREKR